MVIGAQRACARTSRERLLMSLLHFDDDDNRNLEGNDESCELKLVLVYEGYVLAILG